MTVLLVSPDYLSHYLPMSAVGDALRDDGREVVFATGAGLRERVVADGFDHVELRLGAGSNAKAETEGDDPGLSAFIAATREGMVATLELQARRRVDDLLWEPERVTVRLAEIVDDVRPELVLSDQLAFGAGLALRAIRVPFASFLPGHPSQMPQLGMPFGFPGRRPPGFEPDDLAGLYALCAWTARAFTRRFNRTLLDLDPDATPVADAFAEEAPSGTIVNYPASLAGRWPTGGPSSGRASATSRATPSWTPSAAEATHPGPTSRSGASSRRARMSSGGSPRDCARPASRP